MPDLLDGNETAADAAAKAAADAEGDKAAADKAAADKAAADKAAADAGGDKADADKADADKAAADKAKADKAKAGDIYTDFEAIDGVELDQGLIDKAKPLFEKLNLTKEQAQELVNFQAGQVKDQINLFEETKTKWAEEAKADKEIGGEAFEENVKHAISALDKFGTPELKKMLSQYGIGNNVEMIRLMSKVGRLTAEDVPGDKNKNAGEKNSRVNILYPSNEK
jgi:chemotaxis protein histidine kinase CheA